MNNLTRSQKFQIALCLLGVLIAGTSQLDALFGQAITTRIVAAAGLLIAAVSGVGAIVTGPGQQIQAVVDMAKNQASPVQGIITAATPEGKALAASIPGPIVTAGSSAATELSKP
jgi:hypothetical protein